VNIEYPIKLKKLRNEISDLEQKSGEILNINREMQAAFQDKLLMSKIITSIDLSSVWAGLF